MTATTTFVHLEEQFSIEGDLSDAPACNRGLSLMEELRSQMAQRTDFDTSNPFVNVQKGRSRDLFNLIEEIELQGMMSMFSFLHDCGGNELIGHSHHNSSMEHVLCLLDDLRHYIQLRMHPVQDAYLCTEHFENCDSAFDLRMKLGDAKLKGAMKVFNLLHPEEVKPAGSSPVSFTLFYGPPPRARPTRMGDSPARNRGGNSNPSSATQPSRTSPTPSRIRSTPSRTPSASRTSPSTSPPSEAAPSPARALFTS